MKIERFLEWIPSIIIFILYPVISWAYWATHLDMCKKNVRVKKLKKATYRDIKSMMINTKWTFNPLFPKSLFGVDYHKAYFHASIFEFDGVGYLLTPYGYFMASILQRKIAKTLPDYSKYCKPYIN